MRNINFKRNMAFALAMILIITTVKLPVSMSQVYAEGNVETTSENDTPSGNNPGTGGGTPSDNNLIEITIKDKDSNKYANEKEYDAQPVEMPTKENFVICDVSGNTISENEVKLSFKWTDNEGKEVGDAPTNAGDYKLQVSIEENEKYTDTDVYETEVRINAKTLTATINGNVTKTYDGGTGVPEGTLTVALPGVAGNDDVTAEAEFEYKSSGVGNNIQVIARNIKLTGNAANNYTLSTETAEANCGKITPKPLRATISGIVSKVYNGKADVANKKPSIVLQDVVNGDDVKAEAQFKYASSDVGNNIQVIANNIKLTGSDAGNYSVPGEIRANCGTITKSNSTIQEDAERKLNNLEALCGMKLADIDLLQGFSWKNPEKQLISDGNPVTETVVYVQNNDSKNYNPVEKTVTITVKHDLEEIKKQAATQKAAGYIKHEHCKGCGKNFNSKGKELSPGELVIPYFVKGKVELTIGKKISLNKIMLNGTEAYEGMTVVQKKGKKDKEYISVNSKKKTIKAKTVKAKNYKNIQSTVTVRVKFAGGRHQDIKIKLNIPAPKLTVKREKIVLKGIEGYRYTLQYNAKNASKVNIEVKSGVSKSLEKDMNQWIKKRVSGNKGTISFTIRKTDVKKKIKFKMVASYGKKQSLPKTVSK